VRRSLTVRNRVIGVSGALLLAVVVAVLVGIRVSSSTAEAVERFTDHDVPAVQLILNLDRDAYQAQLALRELISATDDEAREAQYAAFVENHDQTGSRFEEYTTVSQRHDGEAALWVEFESTRAAWTDVATPLADAARAGTLPAAEIADDMGVVSARFEEMRATVDGIQVEIYEPIVATFGGEVRADARSAQRSLWLTLGAALLLGSALTWFVARGIAARLAASVSAMTGWSEELASVSSQLSAAAEETAAQANVVAAAGEQVSHNVATVATAAEEMTASVREIASIAGQASSVAAEAVSQAEATNVTVAKMGESSVEIGKVIEVITSIGRADQSAGVECHDRGGAGG
jgi:methyl-accepting chemotaxis protein